MRVVVGTKAHCYINIYIYIHIDTGRVARPAARCYRVWTVWRLSWYSRRGSRVSASGSSRAEDAVVECLRAAHLVQ